MRNERPIHRVKEKHYSDTNVFAVLLSCCGIFSITVFSLVPTAMDKFDKWTSSMKGQIVIFWILVFVIGCFGVKWFVNKIKNI